MLCSYVEFDGDDRPFSLVEPLAALALTPDDRGKLWAPDVALYVQLEDEHAVGTFWVTAEVRTASGIVLPNGRLPPIEFTFTGDSDPLHPFEYVFDVRGLVFPEPGRYHFHVMCNHMSLHVRDAAPPPNRLWVIPSELPS
ncbi:MAG: hypothetical protein C0467_32135 [Planctomycetaceae bacterium]|nr:hypothetical protein [Planctomycetaceae bacterium]